MTKRTRASTTAQAPVEPMPYAELARMFFSHQAPQGIAVNTLTEQILMLNMLTVDLRLLMRLIQLRTDVASQQPMYWAQPMLEQLIRARLIDIRKLTEPHKPDQPTLHTLAFPHLLYLLGAHQASATQQTLLQAIAQTVAAQHHAHAYLVNKYIVHAATVTSRNTTKTTETTASVTTVWQSVLVLNHVFQALYRHIQSDSDMMAYPCTLREHLHDMQRYFLLSESEQVHLRAVLTTSIADLDAIQSRTAAAPWAVHTAQ